MIVVLPYLHKCSIVIHKWTHFCMIKKISPPKSSTPSKIRFDGAPTPPLGTSVDVYVEGCQ